MKSSTKEENEDLEKQSPGEQVREESVRKEKAQWNYKKLRMQEGR